MSESFSLPTATSLRGRWTALIVIFGLLISVPLWLPSLGGYTALASHVLIIALGAMAVNFLLGFTGVLSFGHAAYFGLGGYGAGLTLKLLAHSTPLALLLGALTGGIAGAILGLLIVRRRGVYFAMVTVAFGQVFYYIAYRWNSVTGGDDGLRGFPGRSPARRMAVIHHREILSLFHRRLCSSAVI